jgi:hypothetical protein
MLIAFVVLLVFCASILMFSTYLAVSSVSWPKAKGLVTDKGINQRKTKASGSGLSYYAPSVSYEYVVNNKKYRSSRIDSRLLAYDNEPEAVSVTNLFPVNAEVEVYHHPLFPSISCLRKGIHGKYIYITFYFFCLVPIISIIWSLF